MGLIRTISVLLIGCAVLVVAARFAGSTRADTHFAMLFTKPDGTRCTDACLFGVEPGHTTYADALNMLRTHPFLSPLTPMYVDAGQIMFLGKGITVGLTADIDGMAGSLYMQLESFSMPLDRELDLQPAPFPLNNVTLGDAVTVLGSPDRVEMVSGEYGRLLRVFYVDSVLILNHERIDPNNITMYDPFVRLFLHSDFISVQPDMQRWTGFSTSGRYLRYFMGY
jgi:hypothetical protein